MSCMLCYIHYTVWYSAVQQYIRDTVSDDNEIRSMSSIFASLYCTDVHSVWSWSAIAQFIALVCCKLGFICSIEFNYTVLFDRNKQNSNWITMWVPCITIFICNNPITYDNIHIYSIFLCRKLHPIDKEYYPCISISHFT